LGRWLFFFSRALASLRRRKELSKKKRGPDQLESKLKDKILERHEQEFQKHLRELHLSSLAIVGALFLDPLEALFVIVQKLPALFLLCHANGNALTINDGCTARQRRQTEARSIK